MSNDERETKRAEKLAKVEALREGQSESYADGVVNGVRGAVDVLSLAALIGGEQGSQLVAEGYRVATMTADEQRAEILRIGVGTESDTPAVDDEQRDGTAGFLAGFQLVLDDPDTVTLLDGTGVVLPQRQTV
jgi:hypothetical protein